MSEQTSPIEDGHDDASNNDKIDGIVEQVRADHDQGNVSEVHATIRQRLAESGVNVSDEQLTEISERITRD